jgi:hypothetical protein
MTNSVQNAQICANSAMPWGEWTEPETAPRGKTQPGYSTIAENEADLFDSRG